MSVEEIVTVVAAFGFMLMIVNQVRRLIGQFVLNRTIRIAMERDPASAPLLIAKLETRNPMPIALPGWFTLGLGLLMALATAISDHSDSDAWYISAALVATGAGILGWDWLNRKRSTSVDPLP